MTIAGKLEIEPNGQAILDRSTYEKVQTEGEFYREERKWYELQLARKAQGLPLISLPPHCPQ